MIRLFSIISIISYLLMSNNVYAQQEEEPTPLEYQYWLTYDNYNYFKNKSQFFYTVSFKGFFGNKEKEQWHQLFLRFTYRYLLNSKVELHFGINNLGTLDKQFDNRYELRPYQALLLKWPVVKISKVTFIHFIRFEERIFFPYEEFSDNNALRFRYRLGTKLPINGQKREFKTFYIPWSLEFNVNLFGENVSDRYSSRARMQLGLGYIKDSEWKFEFLTVFQLSRDNDDQPFETSTLLFNIKIKRMVKSIDRRNE